MIFARYLTRLFAVRFIGALLGFTMLVEVLDLFDMAGELLERGQGTSGLARYALLRMPVIMVDVVPFAALIGAIFTFMTLAGKSEIVAMRSLGIPARRIVLLLSPVALAAGAIHLLASDMAAPRAESALRDWMLRTEAPVEIGDEAEYWLRSGTFLIGFAASTPEGTELDHVWIYERDAESRSLRRITADRARFQDPVWILEDGGESGVEGEAVRSIDFGLTPDDVLELSQPIEHLSFGRLYAGATGGPTGARSPAFFQTRLLTMSSFLVIPAIMIIIAAPVAFASARRGRIGLHAAVALAIGLLLVLFAGILRTLGESGVMPPMAAAWSAPLIFAFIAAIRLARVER